MEFVTGGGGRCVIEREREWREMCAITSWGDPSLRFKLLWRIEFESTCQSACHWKVADSPLVWHFASLSIHINTLRPV